MLVLSRKIGERIQIGNDICVTVVRISPNGVRLGIEAPADFTIMREELDEGTVPGRLPASATSQAKPR